MWAFSTVPLKDAGHSAVLAQCASRLQGTRVTQRHCALLLGVQLLLSEQFQRPREGNRKSDEV